jgi:hypothetical protein
MTLFFGASPSYVREGDSKLNASWRGARRRVVDSSRDRPCELRPLIVNGNQWKRAGPSARIGRSVE